MNNLLVDGVADWLVFKYHTVTVIPNSPNPKCKYCAPRNLKVVGDINRFTIIFQPNWKAQGVKLSSRGPYTKVLPAICSYVTIPQQMDDGLWIGITERAKHGLTNLSRVAILLWRHIQIKN